MAIVRKFALAGVVCVATGLAAPASAAPDPATCQAAKPVLDEIMAAAMATGRGIDPGPSPSFAPGHDPMQDILDHYRRAGEAAHAAADKVSDPHVADLFRRMSVVLDTLGSDQAPGSIAQMPHVDKKDGEELASLGKECGYEPDRKQLGLGE